MRLVMVGFCLFVFLSITLLGSWENHCLYLPVIYQALLRLLTPFNYVLCKHQLAPLHHHDYVAIFIKTVDKGWRKLGYCNMPC